MKLRHRPQCHLSCHICWPAPYTGRLLRNRYAETCLGRDDELEARTEEVGRESGAAREHGDFRRVARRTRWDWRCPDGSSNPFGRWRTGDAVGRPLKAKLSLSGARDVLLVKRFDRDKTQAGYRRARTVSALTTSNADFRERSDELPKLLKNN
jgi:hypothetical protein